jgi:zona occludens toxin (predicted ATPase)
LGIKIRREDYDSLREAIADFRHLTWPITNRRHRHVRVRHVIKASSLRQVAHRRQRMPAQSGIHAGHAFGAVQAAGGN